MAQLAAGAFVCPAPLTNTPPPELLRVYGANALHAHGAETANGAAELRAPCPCGCDEAPLGTHGISPLAAALLPAPPVAVLPRAAHGGAREERATAAPTRLPDPVPKRV